MELFLQKITQDEFKALLKQILNDVLNEKGYEIHQRSEYMDIEEVSQLLGMKKKTIYAKTSQRIIPHYKRGRKLVFKRSEILEWLAAGRVGTMKEFQRKAAIDAGLLQKY